MLSLFFFFHLGMEWNGKPQRHDEKFLQLSGVLLLCLYLCLTDRLIDINWIWKWETGSSSRVSVSLLES